MKLTMKSPQNSPDILDATQNDSFAGAPTFTLRHKIIRATFIIAWLVLARWTPPQMRRWRNVLLRAFGARIHRTANIYSSVRIWFPANLSMDKHSCLGANVNCYSIAEVHIGERAVVSQGAHLCTGSHHVDDPNFQLYAAPIFIGAGAWIAADAFVGPGVDIGKGAVLGARGVTVKDLEPGVIYAGNPAKRIRARRSAKDEGRTL